MLLVSVHLRLFTYRVCIRWKYHVVLLLYPFPTPHLVTPCCQNGVSHDGIIDTTEISKCYKSELHFFLIELIVKHSPMHHWPSPYHFLPKVAHPTSPLHLTPTLFLPPSICSPSLFSSLIGLYFYISTFLFP